MPVPFFTLTLVAQLLVNHFDLQVPNAPPILAQQKINTHLLAEIERARSGASPRVQSSERPIVRVDDKQRALVDVRTVVTPAMKDKLITIDGTLVSVPPESQSIVAWLPLLELEALAETPSVRAIEPTAFALTNLSPQR
jgi:hypothetical protein